MTFIPFSFQYFFFFNSLIRTIITPTKGTEMFTCHYISSYRCSSFRPFPKPSWPNERQGFWSAVCHLWILIARLAVDADLGSVRSFWKGGLKRRSQGSIERSLPRVLSKKIKQISKSRFLYNWTRVWMKFFLNKAIDLSLTGVNKNSRHFKWFNVHVYDFESLLVLEQLLE